MRTRRLIGVVACAWAMGAAAVPRCLAAEVADADVQDMIFFGPGRPMLWRLHINIDGKPFREVWQARLASLFSETDSDRDGRVTLEQASQIVRSMHGGAAELENLLSQGSTLSKASDANGMFDRAALSAHLAVQLPQLVLSQRDPVGRGSALALFPLLDANNDHQLSAAELSGAEQRLLGRDFNDDHMITPGELILDPKVLAAAANPSVVASAPRVEASLAMLVDADTPADAIVARLLDYYDRNHDRKLSLAADRELQLPKGAARQLDIDADGSLSESELGQFAKRTSEIELFFSLGKASAADNRNKPRSSESELRIRKTLLGGYDLKLGEVSVAFQRNNTDPTQAETNRFAMLDRDNNNYLDAKEAEAGGLTKATFADMDSDGDGMVTRADYTTYLDRKGTAAGTRLRLEIVDLGQNLFDLLDADSDGVLSPRELRTAGKTLLVHDINGDGLLGGDEIPGSLEFLLYRGVDPRPDPAGVLGARGMRSTTTASSAGPLWFRKMDRNNDGDLELREFLGPREAFDRLDKNHDGFIDQSEAEVAAIVE